LGFLNHLLLKIMKKPSVLSASFAVAFVFATAIARGAAAPSPGASPAPSPAASAPAETAPAPEIAPEKKAEIEKMLKLSGTEKLMAQVMNQMLDSMKKSYTKLPPEYWQKLQQEMDLHSLVELCVPVYDKYYTLDDLKAVNAFYESPAGQKVLASRSQIAAECMKIGQGWGGKIGMKIMEEIKQEKAADEKKQEEDKGKTGAGKTP
jgi:hypothetical protein